MADPAKGFDLFKPSRGPLDTYEIDRIQTEYRALNRSNGNP